jgi:hypothetical protein
MLCWTLCTVVLKEDYPNHRYPGWNIGSIGYHPDDGKIFIGSGIGDPFVPQYLKGDRMGCGILLPRDYMCQCDRCQRYKQQFMIFWSPAELYVLSCVLHKMHWKFVIYFVDFIAYICKIHHPVSRHRVIFVNSYFTEFHYLPVVCNLAAVTPCIMLCFTVTEISRLG